MPVARGMAADNILTTSADQFVSGQLVSDKLVLNRRSGTNPYTFPTSLKGQTGDVGDTGAQGDPQKTAKAYAKRILVEGITPGVVKTQNVTFPAGRFLMPPSVMVTVGGATKAFASYVEMYSETGGLICVITETATKIDVMLIAMTT